ncbi:hypothetical protein RF11_10183 [Thelohanellus kitauei]|uniref:Uncharacterized protein n=1 Tax=Thelohanellus kitauei TaxID=669202 RepID=A0A0C2JNP8_THEKT|nr:hypothetical protein RF11_10183 [Thelohanellus kitauei]
MSQKVVKFLGSIATLEAARNNVFIRIPQLPTQRYLRLNDGGKIVGATMFYFSLFIRRFHFPDAFLSNVRKTTASPLWGKILKARYKSTEGAVRTFESPVGENVLHLAKKNDVDLEGFGLYLSRCL